MVGGVMHEFDKGDLVERRAAWTSGRGYVVAVKDDGETLIVQWRSAPGVAGTKTIEPRRALRRVAI